MSTKKDSTKPTHNDKDDNDEDEKRTHTKKPLFTDEMRSATREVMLIVAITSALYFTWHVFALGAGDVLYHGY